MSPRSIGAGAATLIAVAGTAQAHIQSALHPAGSQADDIATMWWIMATGAAAILILVSVLVLLGLVVRSERPARGRQVFIYVGGIVFPVVTLSALIIYTFTLGNRLTGPLEGEPVRIDVIARQWWWEVHYLAQDGGEAFTTANELHIPIARPVEVRVASPDVIHSFWVPNLAGKIDAIPGRTNRIAFRADKAGVYRGQCAEFCGLQHALMAFYVVAEEPEAYASWLARQRAAAIRPEVPLLARGFDVFMASGCGACHTVRGTSANGTIGPDLTHVGSRQSLAAGTLNNTVGSLAGWIADADHIKKGNGMPSFNVLAGPDLRAVAAWMESLK